MTKTTARLLLGALVCLALGALGCGEDDEETGVSNTTMTSGDTCACPDGVCDPGECVLQIVIADECADQWGTASVFLNDLSSSAAPVGTVSAGQDFTTCEPLVAAIKDTDGNTTQEGEPFEFIVESEDGRQLSGSQGGSTFTCEDSMPFVWTIECN